MGADVGYSRLVKTGTPVALATILLAVLVAASGARAANSYWVSTKDESSCIVSAVVQYDREQELAIRKANGLTETILIMDLHMRNPEDLCRLLVFSQEGIDGRRVDWKPMLCVTDKRENIYHGYVVMPPDFNFNKPLLVTLGDRTVTATFKP
jgi:hypothetical protein